MGKVYDRILKLNGADQSGDANLNLVFMAILNLKSKDEIREFVLDYKRIYPGEYRDNISFILGYFKLSDRELWKESVGDLVGVILQLNRSEKKLATQFTWINGKNQEIKFPGKPEQQQGKHQDILSAGFFSR